MTATDVILSRSLSNRILELTLMPTEACNFRCTYCYEDFALGRMSPSVVGGVKNLLTARAGDLDELHLAWFGGEPLLAVDVIVEIHEHVRALQREHPRLRLSSNMTTNGWRLRPDLLRRLLALGIDEYQISLDGPAEHHDRRRVRLDGRSTFQRIWDNLLALRQVEEPFHVLLRLHVDRENLPDMPAFVARCQAEFGADRRFELFLKPLCRYGGEHDESIPILEAADQGRFAELQSLVRAGARGAAKADSAPANEVCYAAKGNSYIVRADGRLGKCTIVLDHPANQVGRLHADGSLEIDARAVSPWMRGLWSGRAAELICPMIGFAERSPQAPAA